MDAESLMILAKAVMSSIITGAGIGFWAFWSKSQKGETFDVKCMAETVGVSAVLGVLAYFQGFEMTVDNWQTYAATNAGVVHVVDKGLAIARNWWLKRNG